MVGGGGGGGGGVMWEGGTHFLLDLFISFMHQCLTFCAVAISNPVTIKKLVSVHLASDQNLMSQNVYCGFVNAYK